MKQYLLYIWTVLIFTACSSLKKTSNIQNEELDVILFSKGVSILEVIDEAYFNYDIRNTDTTAFEGTIKYETLYNKREDILYLAFEQFEKIVKDYPNSKLYHKSLYNLAHISSLMDDQED